MALTYFLESQGSYLDETDRARLEVIETEMRGIEIALEALTEGTEEFNAAFDELRPLQRERMRMIHDARFTRPGE
jgi:hypothetical protein